VPHIEDRETIPAAKDIMIKNLTSGRTLNVCNLWENIVNNHADEDAIYCALLGKSNAV
jgi:hypothetical protein